MFLTPRQAQFAFVPVLSLVMSGVIRLVMTALYANGSKAFVAAWLSGWLLAFIVALRSHWWWCRWCEPCSRA
ncbi:DUF2798 domain-containing protein [Lysobacter zhanggongensis]|uniref:DUF2798 domain-containing protein n=1 Tax=Lysobacter zhanggongensis TaxID=1774951 RepID=A0ABU7YR84_9GAMM